MKSRRNPYAKRLKKQVTLRMNPEIIQHFKSMDKKTLHITSGDIAGASLAKAGLSGEVLVWHDILYDGPRRPGWPADEVLEARAIFLEQTTGGGLKREFVLDTLRRQYRRLAGSGNREGILLWFDACLFDQSMLVHILACLHAREIRNVELLCVDAFPGIEPFHGIGQLVPEQFASLYGSQHPVTEEQFEFAVLVDRAFADQDLSLLEELSAMTDAPLPWMPAAAARWLQELPDSESGIGRLEFLALEAVRGGCDTPGKIFETVSAVDTPPRFWGETTLWAGLNALADRVPPLIRIEGTAKRLPQWESDLPLEKFKIEPLPN
jgi:hypothetical protein